MVRSIDEHTIEDFQSKDDEYFIDKEIFKINTALVVYQSNKNNQYMEKINFKEDQGNNSMIAVGSSPVRMKDIYAMRKALNMIKDVQLTKEKDLAKNRNFIGIMPNNIIYWSRDDYRKIIWTIKPGIIKINMAYENEIYNIPMDTILFATDGDNIKGFLLPKTKEINEDNLLDQLPLPNFYSSNNMCNGNTELGSYKTMEDYISAWENRVFETNYSNENLGVGGLTGLRKLDGKKRLPKSYRVRSNVTISNLIEWLT